MRGRFRNCGGMMILLTSVLAVSQAIQADDDSVVDPRQAPVARPAGRVAGNAQVLNNQQLLLQLLVAEPILNRHELNNLVKVKVDEYTLQYGLSSTQQKKMRMAAHNDVNAHVQELEDLITRIRAANEITNTLNLQEANLALRNHESNMLRQETKTLQRKQTKLLESGSFLSKSMVNILTAEQMEQYRGDLEERARINHRGSIETAVREVERKVVLSIPQVESLTKLLLREIPPPQVSSDHDYLLVQYQVSTLPESKLKPLFDQSQWPAVSGVLNEFRKAEAELTKLGFVVKRPAENGAKEPNFDRPAPMAPANRGAAVPVVKEGS